MIKICKKCGKEYKTDTRRRQYCSRDCAYSDRPNNKVTLICEQCSVEFKTFPSRAATRRFCSEACQNEWQKLAQSGAKNAQWKGVGVARICNYCRRTYKSSKPVSESKFCCDACRISYLTESQKKETHPSWKGGVTPLRRSIESTAEYKTWRKKVFKRDRYHCAICGSNTRIEVHHIRPFADYPDLRADPKNGITLCHKHHLDTYSKEDQYESYFDNILLFFDTFYTKYPIRVAV